MAGLLTPETLVLVLYFVVPGFMLIRTYDLIIPTERRNFTQAFVDVVAFSFMILTFWFWPYILLISYRDLFASWQYYALLFILTILVAFVTPAFLAWRFYISRTRGFLKGRTPHPSPSSWDWFFSEKADNYYVRFHLKEGEGFGGYYGEESFATSFPNKLQVYVEEVWQLDKETGKLAAKVDGTEGAIVNLEDCKMIEFLEVRDKTEIEEG